MQQARLYANNVSGGRHGLRERIAAAEKTLWEIDSDYRAEQEREVAERLAREEEGAKRYYSERNTKFNNAVEAVTPRIGVAYAE